MSKSTVDELVNEFRDFLEIMKSMNKMPPDNSCDDWNALVERFTCVSETEEFRNMNDHIEEFIYSPGKSKKRASDLTETEMSALTEELRRIGEEEKYGTDMIRATPLATFLAINEVFTSPVLYKDSLQLVKRFRRCIENYDNERVELHVFFAVDLIIAGDNCTREFELLKRGSDQWELLSRCLKYHRNLGFFEDWAKIYSHLSVDRLEHVLTDFSFIHTKVTIPQKVTIPREKSFGLREVKHKLHYEKLAIRLSRSDNVSFPNIIIVPDNDFDSWMIDYEISRTEYTYGLHIQEYATDERDVENILREHTLGDNGDSSTFFFIDRIYRIMADMKKKQKDSMDRVLYLFDVACESNSDIESFLLHCIGLEVLLLHGQSGEIADKFSTRCALLFGQDDKQRERIRSFAKHLYSMRSTLAHGKELRAYQDPFSLGPPKKKSNKEDEQLKSGKKLADTFHAGILRNMLRTAIIYTLSLNGIIQAGFHNNISEITIPEIEKCGSYIEIMEELDSNIWDASLRERLAKLIKHYWNQFGVDIDEFFDATVKRFLESL